MAKLGNKNRRKPKEVAGYYCDCVLSSEYDHPNQIPKDLDPITYDRVSDATLVKVGKDRKCPFCGYRALYSEAEPLGVKCSEHTVVFKKKYSTNPKTIESRNRHAEKQEKKRKEAEQLKNEDLATKVRRLVAATGKSTGADDRLPRGTEV